MCIVYCVGYRVLDPPSPPGFYRVNNVFYLCLYESESDENLPDSSELDIPTVFSLLLKSRISSSEKGEYNLIIQSM